jgi:hypothetical protein
MAYFYTTRQAIERDSQIDLSESELFSDAYVKTHEETVDHFEAYADDFYCELWEDGFTFPNADRDDNGAYVDSKYTELEQKMNDWFLNRYEENLAKEANN